MTATRIESALARPLNLAAYGNPDAADLAAASAYGLASNHGFLDGNKRTAWVTARLFLADNGQRLEFYPLDTIRVVEDVAAGPHRRGCSRRLVPAASQDLKTSSIVAYPRATTDSQRRHDA